MGPRRAGRRAHRRVQARRPDRLGAARGSRNHRDPEGRDHRRSPPPHLAGESTRTTRTQVHLAPPGRLAQLGERRLDKAEVAGSSPASPIGPFAGICCSGGLRLHGCDRWFVATLSQLRRRSHPPDWPWRPPPIGLRQEVTISREAYGDRRSGRAFPVAESRLSRELVAAKRTDAAVRACPECPGLTRVRAGLIPTTGIWHCRCRSALGRPTSPTRRFASSSGRPPMWLPCRDSSSAARASFFPRMVRSSFPRRQQRRRLRRAAASSAAAIAASALAAVAIDAGATAPAGLLALVTAALVLDARHWAGLAARSRRRRSVRGSGPTSARRAGGGGVAAAALAPVSRSWGHRQRRDRTYRHRVRDCFLPLGWLS